MFNESKILSSSKAILYHFAKLAVNVTNLPACMSVCSYSCENKKQSWHKLKNRSKRARISLTLTSNPCANLWMGWMHHLTLRTHFVSFDLSVTDLVVWAIIGVNCNSQILIKKNRDNVSRRYNYMEASNPWNFAHGDSRLESSTTQMTMSWGTKGPVCAYPFNFRLAKKLMNRHKTLRPLALCCWFGDVEGCGG